MEGWNLGSGEEFGYSKPMVWFGMFLKVCAVLALQCSASCGEGVMERMVQCLADGQGESQGCSQDDKPKARKVCRNPSCEF